jgi:hypothetical protein
MVTLNVGDLTDEDERLGGERKEGWCGTESRGGSLCSVWMGKDSAW